MKVKYIINLAFVLEYEADTLTDLKREKELAEDICHMVMDELPLVDGTGTYYILDCERVVSKC